MKLAKSDKKMFFSLLFPTLIETVIIRFFHIADSIMLGQMADSTASVAAVGLCTAPINLIASTTSAFFMGTTATVAWLSGANEKKSMRTVCWQSMSVATVLAVILALLSAVFSRQIMSFICEDGEVLEIAASYYRINAYGFLFQIITGNITAVLRGIGISKLPMIYNITGGIFNVLLNALFIYGLFGVPAMRADGAALATTISKFISMVFALAVLLFKDTELNLKYGINKKLENSIKTRLIPIGLTAACEQLILQVGAIFTAKITAVLPTDKIAANQVVASLEGFAWATGSATQAATTTLFGRSLGEHRSQKAKSYLRLAVKTTLVFAFAEMLVFTVFGRPLAAAFSNDISLYPLIAELLVLAALSLPFINVHQTVSGALRSAGDSIAPLIASFISLWFFRVGLGFLTISVFELGIHAYRVCLIIDQCVRCTVVTVFYLTGHWKKFILKKRKNNT